MEVQIPCPCPKYNDGPRHPNGDTITLRETLDPDQAMACKQAMTMIERTDDDEALTAERLAAVVKQYLFVGIEKWTLANGSPIPVTPGAIRQYIMSDFALYNAVSEEAEVLYNRQVLLPLIPTASMSSPPTPTDELTSPQMDSMPSPRKRSKRSSTSTSPTDSTEPTT